MGEHCKAHNQVAECTWICRSLLIFVSFCKFMSSMIFANPVLSIPALVFRSLITVIRSFAEYFAIVDYIHSKLIFIVVVAATIVGCTTSDNIRSDSPFFSLKDDLMILGPSYKCLTCFFGYRGINSLCVEHFPPHDRSTAESLPNLSFAVQLVYKGFHLF